MPLVPINIYLLELFFKVLNFIKRKLSYLRRDHKDETEVMMILEPDNFKKFNFQEMILTSLILLDVLTFVKPWPLFA